MLHLEPTPISLKVREIILYSRNKKKIRKSEELYINDFSKCGSYSFVNKSSWFMGTGMKKFIYQVFLPTFQLLIL